MTDLETAVHAGGRPWRGQTVRVTSSPPVVYPRSADLDDLELLRRGFYGPGARMRPLRVPSAVAEAALVAGAVTLADPEGVPVAHLTGPVRTESGALTGDVHWVATVSGRPFQQLHLEAPTSLGAGTVVVESSADLASPPAPGARVLVLASTSLDGDARGNALVRAAVASAPGRVAVVPLPPGDPARRAALFAALALTDPGPRPGAAPRLPGGGLVVLTTGLSGSGKSTIARAVATRLIEEGTTVTLLDGDRVRRHLTAGLGFSPEDRDTNVRRIGWVAAEVAHHGGVAICSPIAPNDEVRREVAAMVAARGGRFVLVHVATPLEECERRDRKGLYAAARRGEIPDFTGISAPYDVPEDPDLLLDTTGREVDECASLVLDLVERARSGAPTGG